ncbi:MAG TPA: heme o synthase [Candidatus Acidoferrum sp.]|nr:heme o synthase [Candidatus Acidoferrum sp.]
MKAAVPTLAVAPALEKSRASDKSPAAVLAELFKMRLTILVLLTTFVGFYAGWRGPMPGGLLFHTMLGTALLAAGASALNQLLEREYDAKMRRTQDRPLPSGRVTPEAALLIGGVCAGTGLIYLALTVNHLTALLGALTLVTYLLVYTPLKRVTTLNTAVGAIPGALPPLMGWTAARGEITGEGWSLFAILFFWQLPHFLAIAWMYREDYARGGFVMLPVVDPAGARTGRQALSHTLGLLPVSLCPFLFGLAGPVYLAGALALGAGFLWCAWGFARRISLAGARRLFYASILYLPLLLLLIVINKK